MCDDKTVAEQNAYLRRSGLTRRVFTAAASAAFTATGFAQFALADSVYSEADLTQRDVKVPTPDGEVDCTFIHPKEGTHAAVIFWPDVHGARPAHVQMARMLAAHGYSVLAANPYYRTHEGQLFFNGMHWGDPGARELVTPHYSVLTSETVVTDAAALTKWLDTQPAVDTSRGFGAVGFCMTGAWGLRAAAALPNRVKAPCSFHGGGLVTKDPDSPHLLVDRMTGGALIAISEDDHNRDPDAKPALIAAFEKANVPAEIEVYENAIHGWVPIDSPVYNPKQSERAWVRMLALFKTQLAG